MDLKQEFVNACNNLDEIDFINASAKYLQVVSSTDELNDFINMFGRVSKIKSIEKSAELEFICILIRDKVYSILMANGEVPENTYIYLYNYFALCKLPEDAMFAAYEQFVDQNLYSEEVSDLERVYLLVLRFFASMANSRKDAFERFLSDVMRLHVLDVGSISFSTFISEFLNESNVDIEEVFAVLNKLWGKEFYFSLNKTHRRSIFNWSLHSLWLAQKYFSHPSWTSFYPLWKEIFYEHIARDECDEAMYVQFFIYHKMGNSFQTQAEWKMFNDDIDRPAADYYKKWCDRANLPKCKEEQSSGKKIIGILQDRLVENSPFKVLYSVLKNAMGSSEFRNQYEVRVYLMSYFEKSENDSKCIDMLARLGITIWDGAGPFYAEGIYHSHLSKALYIRDKILSDGVDILIHGACYDINDFLVVSRIAPKQIYWIHGNFEFDIPNIDKRISHISEKSYMKQSHYGVEHFDGRTDDMFTNPDEDAYKQKASILRNKFPQNTIILGAIGRLVKIDNYEYLEAVAQIMMQCEDTIYLACGDGNIDSVRQKAIEVGIPMDRFFFEGHVDPHLYGYIIDVYLNTFPERSGEALNEFLAKDSAKYAVSLED